MVRQPKTSAHPWGRPSGRGTAVAPSTAQWRWVCCQWAACEGLADFVRTGTSASGRLAAAGV